MSPVVRKYGMWATVVLCSIAFSVSSLALVSVAVAGEAGLISIISPESWFQWAERYGAPMVVLFILGILFIKAVRAVWEFIKPIISRFADSGLALIDKQSQFIDKQDERQDRLESALLGTVNGHSTTHDYLKKITKQTEEIHRNVKDVHEKFGR